MQHETAFGGCGPIFEPEMALGVIAAIFPQNAVQHSLASSADPRSCFDELLHVRYTVGDARHNCSSLYDSTCFVKPGCVAGTMGAQILLQICPAIGEKPVAVGAKLNIHKHSSHLKRLPQLRMRPESATLIPVEEVVGRIFAYKEVGEPVGEIPAKRGQQLGKPLINQMMGADIVSDVHGQRQYGRKTAIQDSSF